MLLPQAFCSTAALAWAAAPAMEKAMAVKNRLRLFMVFFLSLNGWAQFCELQLSEILL
ncbi:hypothetical protein D3C84_1225280 [compost metagenome]